MSSNNPNNQHGSWLVATVPSTVTNANDDSATVVEGGTVSVLDDGATSVLANDLSVDRDTLTVNKHDARERTEPRGLDTGD